MIKRKSDAVYLATEQERHDCEVNYVSKKPSGWIKEYLAGVHQKRGLDAYSKLRNDVLKEWRKGIIATCADQK